MDVAKYFFFFLFLRNDVVKYIDIQSFTNKDKNKNKIIIFLILGH